MQMCSRNISIILVYLGLYFVSIWIYWSYIRPRHYKKLFNNPKQLKGFKYPHSNNAEPEQLVVPISNTNCHLLVYVVQAQVKLSFSK